MGRVCFFHYSGNEQTVPVILQFHHHTATRGVLGGPQRAGQLGGAYSLETYTGSTVGLPGALGPARSEVAGGRGVGRWGRTQFSQITNCFVCIFFILELILLAFIFTE